MPVRSHLEGGGGEKPCRACTDFKSWAKMTEKKVGERNLSTAVSIPTCTS